MNLPRPALLVVLACALAACQPDTPPPASDTPAIPDSETAIADTPAESALDRFEWPALQVTTVTGEPYDLVEHRGHWVVVNFWATWCAPCLKEMPELSDLHARRGDINVMGLAYEDIEADAMHAFLDERPVGYPIAIVDTANPPPDFATPRGLPTTYLIDPDGKVARQFLGPVTAQQIELVVAGAKE